MHRRPWRLLWQTCVLLGAPAWIEAQVPIDTMSLRAHTYFLAHDLLHGRSTGSPEGEIAAHYIASQCLTLGLHPVSGRYLHPVALEAATLQSAGLTLHRSARAERFASPRDLKLIPGTRSAWTSVRGPAVYVGPSDEVPPGVELTGAIAITVGPWGTAERNALATRGVIGIVQLTGSDDAFNAERSGDDGLYHRDSSVTSSFLGTVPTVIASPRLSYALVGHTPLARGEPLEQLPLGVDLALDIDVQTAPVNAANVTCLLPGSAPGVRDTAIAFTAHHDHLGIGSPDARGDSIYNGFSDNAAGVAMVLGIAHAMAVEGAAPPHHTMLFLFFTGEESGLLGSDAYVAAPAWPLERTRAVINLDAGAPPAPPTTWRLAGVADTGLGAVASAVAQRQGWEISTSPPRANSDYFPFVRRGVPAVFIIPGPGPYDGLTADSSDALRRRWDRYHQAGDEWAPDFPFAGLQRYAEFALRVARALDGSATPVDGR